jgi:hypothetical protein
LDCNGFVGNYLRYRNSETKWNSYDPVSSKTIINGDMGINSIVTKVAPEPVKSVDEMLAPRMHVLGMVDKAGNVIDGGFGPIGHIMVHSSPQLGPTGSLAADPETISWQTIPVLFRCRSHTCCRIERFQVHDLEHREKRRCTVWRDKVFGAINVKIYAVN